MTSTEQVTGAAQHLMHTLDRTGDQRVMWDDVPPEDADIAQMLALVTDEDAFLAVANATPRRPLRAVPPAAGRQDQQLPAAA